MDHNEFQVGDVVRRIATAAFPVRTRTVESVNDDGTISMSRDVEGTPGGMRCRVAARHLGDYSLLTPRAKYQVGDIIWRAGFGYRRITATDVSTSSGNPAYRHTYAGNTAARVLVETRTNAQTVEYVDNNYTLVERPGDTNKEEVKDMSNFEFKVGDIIRYTSDRTILRTVTEVGTNSYNESTYTVSGTLTDPDPMSSDWTDVCSYFEGSYELLLRPSASAGEVTDAHKADMATLSTKLAAEARRRGWCSDYQSIVGAWNADLTVPLEPYPQANIRTVATFMVTIQQTDQVDGNISAGDHAYNVAYNVRGEIEAPNGWELVETSVQTYTGTTV